MDRIALHAIPIECIIGVNPEERLRSQKVEVDLTLELDVVGAARSAQLSESIDYAEVVEHIGFILQESKFLLLESACLALCAYLLAPPCPARARSQIGRATVTLRKPSALPQGCPSVSTTRDLSWLQISQEHKPFGTVDILFETPHTGIYRLHIAPGGTIPLHIHRKMEESEMVITDKLHCQGEPIAPGSIRRWNKDEAHVYTNESSVTQSILCIDRPPFIEEDEIAV